MRRRSKLTALEIITKSNVPNPPLWGSGNAEPFLVSLYVCVCVGFCVNMYKVTFLVRACARPCVRVCMGICVHIPVYSELSLYPFTILSKLRVSTVNTNMNTDTNTLIYQPFCFWQGPSPFSQDYYCRKSCLSPPSESAHRTCVGIGHH